MRRSWSRSPPQSAARVSDTGCTGTPGVRHLRSGLIAALLGLVLLSAPVVAQRLVADIHPADPRAPEATRSSSPRGYVAIGKQLWFLGDAGSLGTRVFVTDGTQGGTTILPALLPRAIEPLDDRRAIILGDGIWVSDGTLPGTARIAAVGHAPDAYPARYRARVGDRVYFQGLTKERGYEPWVTDGTPQGTRMLRESIPGPEPMTPYWHVLGSLNGRLYIAGMHVDFGVEPWSTDGTPEGTRMLCDLNPGLQSSLGTWSRFLVDGARAFFPANIQGVGIGPCVTDGTAAGTFVLTKGQTAPRWAEDGVVAGGRLFFLGETAANGAEPWVSDGTPEGTFEIADLRPGWIGSGPTSFRVLGSRAVFVAWTPAMELFTVDGARGGFLQVPGPAGPPLLLRGDTTQRRAFYFGHDPAYGLELHVTDGTVAGTSLVFDGNPGPDSSTWFPEMHAVAGGYLFFHRDAAHGLEPWFTDGTPRGTRLLRDIWPGAESSRHLNYVEVAPFASGLVFTAQDADDGREPWFTDGTPEGTRLFVDAMPELPPGSDPRLLGSLRDRAVLFAFDRVHGFEPWATDGSERGTELLRDVQPGNNPMTPSGAWGQEVNDRFVFVTGQAATGRELWVTDGTAAGTSSLGDRRPGPLGSEPRLLATVGRRCFFFAHDEDHGRELWLTDGTVAGTRLVKDVVPGLPGCDPGFEQVAGTLPDGRIVFFAQDWVHGIEPWISDGTAAGTRMLRDVYAGWRDSAINNSPYPQRFARVGDGRILFTAQSADWMGIWVTDGTENGTQPLIPNLDLLEFQDAGPAIPGKVFISGLGIWITDGTTQGTVQLTEDGGDVVVLNDKVLLARRWNSPRTIWVTDGTVAGTRLVFGSGGEVVIGKPVASGSRAFFRGTDSAHGSELWVTDGTTAGTRLVLDLEPGWLGTAPAEPWIVAAGDNGRVFFNARDRAHGDEIWVSDGTAAGTRLVGDLYPGVLSSDPKPFARVGEQWLFVAQSPDVGRELFAVDLRDVGAAIARPFGAGCAGTGARAPLLGARGAPVIGATGFAAELQHARPLSPAVLLLARGPEPSFLAGGCSFYLQPLPADLRTVITDALGEARVPLQVPQDPHLVGLLLHAQALVLDPHGAWLGLLSFSNGLELVIGR